MSSSFWTLCQLCSTTTSAKRINLDTVDWTRVWQQALRHRVGPVMAYQMKNQGISAPASIEVLIKKHIHQNLLKGLKQTAELVRITKILNHNNIPFLAFKGVAFNHLTGIELTQRHTGDIDILIANFDHIEKTDKVLKGIGYERLTLPRTLEMNSQQKKHFIKYEKDVVYFHPENEVSLEVHFKLFPVDRLLSIPTQEIYKNRSEITIGSTKVPVMSKNDHLLYLLVHGAWSSWFRLKWLCDIPLISNNGDDYRSPAFIKRAKSLGAERIVWQGLTLANELLKMPIDNIPGKANIYNKETHQLVAFAKSNLLDKELYNKPLLGKIKFWISFVGFYLPNLKPDFLYRRDHFKSCLMSVSDWEVLRLPASLFWLYYPLRPLLWLKRQF